MRSIAALLTALLMLAPTPGAAAPFGVQIGGVTVGLDAPPGFSDSRFTGSPRLEELAESVTSASNRILLFALTDADLRAFMQGDRPEFRRYMLAVTPRRLEYERMTAEQFERLVADTVRQLGPAPAAPSDARALLDKAPPGRPVMLDELERSADTVSVLQGSRVPAGDSPWSDKQNYSVQSITLTQIRGKAIGLTVYTSFENPRDLEWIRFITRRWLDDLRRLNAR